MILPAEKNHNQGNRKTKPTIAANELKKYSHEYSEKFYLRIRIKLFMIRVVEYFNDKYKEWIRRQSCTLEPAEFILQHFEYLQI